MASRERSTTLPARLIEQLLQSAIVCRYAAGERITTPNQHPRSVPFVLDGVVKVLYQLDRGEEELLLYFLESSDYCLLSLLAAVCRSPSHVYGVAETSCRVAFIPVEHFLTWVAREPLLLEHLFGLYHRRIEELLELIGWLKFARLRDRVLTVLQQKCSYAGSTELTITHEEFAHELGTSRVVVSRILKELEREGIVELHRGAIRLLQTSR